jgi:hypothetical protein
MAEQPKSAAAALYPHLRQGTPDEIVERKRIASSAADAMYPRPKPPLKNPYLSPMTQQEYRDQFFEMCGLRRKR